MPKVDFLDSKTCTLVGLITNVALAIFKLLAGMLSFSYAMIADGIHSISDCFATGTVYVGLRIGERPADESHPYGHANAETITGFLVFRPHSWACSLSLNCQDVPYSSPSQYWNSDG
jgi:Co/Zn/Cd efflux system component